MLHLRQKDRVLEIPREGGTIGRGAHCAVTIQSFMVSREHCRVRHGTDCLLFKDLGSKNGTFVNDVAVGDKEVAAKVGDSIRIGFLKLTVIDEAELQTLDVPRLPLSGMPSEISETIRVSLEMMRGRPGKGEDESST